MSVSIAILYDIRRRTLTALVTKKGLNSTERHLDSKIHYQLYMDDIITYAEAPEQCLSSPEDCTI